MQFSLRFTRRQTRKSMPLLSLSDISEKTYISYTETPNKEEKQFKAVLIAQRDDL